MTDVNPIPKTRTPKKRREKMPQDVAEEVGRRSHGLCEARLRGCTHLAESLHHRLLRKHGGPNTPACLLAVCESCHRAIHANPADSYERGLLLHPWSDEAKAIVAAAGLLTEQDEEQT